MVGEEPPLFTWSPRRALREHYEDSGPHALSGRCPNRRAVVPSSPPASPPTDVVAEEHGISLIHSPAESAALRRQRERPAAIGRYPMLLLGAVCSGSAAALWFTLHHSPVAMALLAFGFVLIALGGTLHLFLLRDRERWPEQAHAWDEGIEILLHDGEVKATLWTDPKLALDVFVRSRKAGQDDERLLHWRMDPAVPPCDLTKEGFDRLMQAVSSHDLKLAEYRAGRKGRESRAYEIRAQTYRLQLDRMSRPADPTRTAP